jgi:hypothetical protein
MVYYVKWQKLGGEFHMASIHSFNEYLYQNFYNEIFNSINDHVQEFPGKMGGDSGIDYPDDASIEDLQIRMTGVEDAPGDGISFLVIVEAELEIVSIIRYYRDV